MQVKETVVHKMNRFSLPIFFVIILFIFPVVIFVTASSARAARGLHVDWTPKEIIQTAVPLQTIDKTVNFSFTLSKQFPIKYDVTLKASPDLQPFISINPKSIQKVVSNQEYSTQLTISIPSDTEPGEYEGSIRLFVRMHWVGLFWPKWKGRPASPNLKVLIKVSSQTVDLSVKHANDYPTRIAQGPDGKFYVTDALAGSVFIYNSHFDLAGKLIGIAGELKGFDSPLGIAVDTEGNIYVGNNGRDNVEVYRADGIFKRTIDDGNIEMPNDMVLDLKGNLYVVDSKADMIKVYDPAGQWLRDIGGPGNGTGNLNFPVSAVIVHSPSDQDDSAVLYVADQGHAKIQVYDLSGSPITSFGEKIAAFSSDWQGKFAKIQSLDFDSQNRLHVLDCYLNKIQILNPDVTLAPGADRYIDAYGEFGHNKGQLNLPMDIFIIDSSQMMVTNAGNHKVEKINYP